jgi:hypothetical protein
MRRLAQVMMRVVAVVIVALPTLALAASAAQKGLNTSPRLERSDLPPWKLLLGI